MLPFALLISIWIYYNYFKGRPQMISSFMIVWFFVYLREYQLKAKGKYATAMIILSWMTANFHAGVWLVIAVFTGMALFESLLDQTINLSYWAGRPLSALCMVFLNTFPKLLLMIIRIM
ncbi:hypothetical protein A3848_05395 [Paenibacillus sp. P32E]|nr:hypothetical protein A3848_05395 [Paenibacillus sp. P32E]